MKKFPFVSLCLFAGSIFDLRGTIAKGIREYTALRSRPQPRNVQEAFLMDMKSIGADMRKAMDKWNEIINPGRAPVDARTSLHLYSIVKERETP